MSEDIEFEKHVVESLARIEEKVAVLPDHEKRLRWLERLAYGLIGAWVFLTSWFAEHIIGGHK